MTTELKTLLNADEVAAMLGVSPNERSGGCFRQARFLSR